MGGGSWARLGSDGAWVPLIAARGIEVAPLRPANCGFLVASPRADAAGGWSEHFRSRFAGHAFALFFAVAVTLRKMSGQNNGQVQTFFARFWNVMGIDQSVTAVAAPSSPGLMQPGGIFPLTMAQCMYDTYWDRSVYPPRPRTDPATGKPWVFQIGSGYHYGACSSGEWTSLLNDANDVGTIRQLITQGNPVSLEMGQNIWIEPGSKTTLYQTVQKCSAAGDHSCEYVVVPTVTQTDNHALSPITGFACLRILDANGGQKYVLAEMSNRCNSSLSGGAGPNYGVLQPPSLVQ